jgi:hypothetical protein
MHIHSFFNLWCRSNSHKTFCDIHVYCALQLTIKPVKPHSTNFCRHQSPWYLDFLLMPVLWFFDLLLMPFLSRTLSNCLLAKISFLFPIKISYTLALCGHLLWYATALVPYRKWHLLDCHGPQLKEKRNSNTYIHSVNLITVASYFTTAELSNLIFTNSYLHKFSFKQSAVFSTTV